MSVAIQWNGMNECRALFQRLREQTDDLSPVLDFIGHTLTESAKERIADTKQTPDGQAWQALDAKYARRKRNKLGNGDQGLLIYSNNLLQSMTYNVETDKVIVGASEEYAIYVNAEREFLGISNDDGNTINNHIRSVLNDD